MAQYDVSTWERCILWETVFVSELKTSIEFNITLAGTFDADLAELISRLGLKSSNMLKVGSPTRYFAITVSPPQLDS